MNRLKIVKDKRQNQLSESVVWPLLSREEVCGIDGIKTQ